MTSPLTGPTGGSSHPAPRVVLGVAGGIAAYKVCEVLRRLTESGHDVTVVPTAAALRFVGAATWEALSGRPVATDVFTDVDRVAHVRIGREADLVLVVPATADLLARMTHGRADDLLTKTDSKYKLVLYSAQRARQINAYYSQLGEGLLEYVGPLVDTHVQEKPLSIALREINDDLLTCEDIDPAAEAAAAEAAAGGATE